MQYFLYFVQDREVAPSGLTLLLLWMSFGGHFDQPVSIAMHWPIGQVVPYQRMCGNRHGLAENAAQTESSWWGCCAMVRVAVACFVVVAWLWYDKQVVTLQRPNNSPTIWNFPPIYHDDKMVPRAWWAQRNNLLTAEVIPQGWTVGERWK